MQVEDLRTFGEAIDLLRVGDVFELDDGGIYLLVGVVDNGKALRAFELTANVSEELHPKTRVSRLNAKIVIE